MHHNYMASNYSSSFQTISLSGGQENKVILSQPGNQSSFGLLSFTCGLIYSGVFTLENNLSIVLYKNLALKCVPQVNFCSWGCL